MNDVRPLRTLSLLGVRLATLATLATVPLLAPPPARSAVQPEYASLLTLGRAAYDRRDFPAAVRDFRLACFGMLDEPKLLADCLSRLALAQDRANDLEGFQQTFQRLEEIEEKFAAYSQGELAPELRTSLEPRIVARIPAATLEAAPGFRFLAPKKADALAAGAKSPAAGPPGKGGKPAAPPGPAAPPAAGAVPPPNEKPKTPPATVSPPPDPARSKPTSPSPAPSSSALLPSSPAKPPAAPGPTAAPAGRPWTETERERVQQARDKLAVEQTAHELKSIFDTVKEIADVHPESRETQHLVGQAAYRLSRWNEAVTYFKRGGDPGDEQSELLFYIAVSQYESGDKGSAAATLKRSLPNLKRTAYVDKYAKKILGQ